MKSDHQALHQGPFPVSDPTGAGDFFLKKTKNIDLSQAEGGGLSSFGKNCKQGRPLITVWFKLLESSLGVKQIRFTVFCTCSNTEHITLWLLWRKTQRQELCHSLISTLRAVSALDKCMWHQLHQCQLLLPMLPLDFCLCTSVLCSLFPFFSCPCPSAVPEVTILQCWQSGPCCSLAYKIDGPQFYFFSVCIQIHFTF